MRRAVDKPTAFWSARVSAHDKEEFKNLLPLHGAQTACFGIALEKFLEAVQADPELRKFVHDDIQRHLHEENKGGPTAELTVNVPSAKYISFNELFPEQGATSWFIRRTLKALNHQLASFVLDERIEQAVRSILRSEEISDHA